MMEMPVDKRNVQRVVIAGGGTAGWIAAAALVKQLGPLLDITLVESEEIGTVGVGESTIPTSRAFHNFLGIDEQAFMRATQASFKLGISFENWGRDGERYFHSFGTIGRASTWMGEFHHLWLHARERGLTSSLDDYCFELKAADAGRFATGADGGSTTPIISTRRAMPASCAHCPSPRASAASRARSLAWNRTQKRASSRLWCSNPVYE